MRLPSQAIARAREHRAKPTDAEGLLWWKLRDLNRRGFRFRRQAPFRGYFLDFIDHGGKVVAELDGSQHGFGERRRHDAVRDGVLAREGYLVLRFSNREVFDGLDRVVDAVVRTISEPRPPTPKIAPRFLDLPTRGR